jgi:hypothetical protein
MRPSGAVDRCGTDFRLLTSANEGADMSHGRLMVLTFLISLWLFAPMVHATTYWVLRATGPNANAPILGYAGGLILCGLAFASCYLMQLRLCQESVKQPAKSITSCHTIW